MNSRNSLYNAPAKKSPINASNWTWSAPIRFWPDLDPLLTWNPPLLVEVGSEIRRRAHWKRGMCIKVSEIYFAICDKFATKSRSPHLMYKTKYMQFRANLARNLRQICAMPPARTPPFRKFWGPKSGPDQVLGEEVGRGSGRESGWYCPVGPQKLSNLGWFSLSSFQGRRPTCSLLLSFLQARLQNESARGNLAWNKKSRNLTAVAVL